MDMEVVQQAFARGVDPEDLPPPTQYSHAWKSAIRRLTPTERVRFVGDSFQGVHAMIDAAVSSLATKSRLMLKAYRLEAAIAKAALLDKEYPLNGKRKTSQPERSAPERDDDCGL